MTMTGKARYKVGSLVIKNVRNNEIHNAGAKCEWEDAVSFIMENMFFPTYNVELFCYLPFKKQESDYHTYRLYIT